MPFTYTCPTCDTPHGSLQEYLDHEKTHPRVQKVGLPKPVIEFVSQGDAQRGNQ